MSLCLSQNFCKQAHGSCPLWVAHTLDRWKKNQNLMGGSWWPCKSVLAPVLKEVNLRMREHLKLAPFRRIPQTHPLLSRWILRQGLVLNIQWKHFEHIASVLSSRNEGRVRYWSLCLGLVFMLGAGGNLSLSKMLDLSWWRSLRPLNKYSFGAYCEPSMMLYAGPLEMILMDHPSELCKRKAKSSHSHSYSKTFKDQKGLPELR